MKNTLNRRKIEWKNSQKNSKLHFLKENIKTTIAAILLSSSVLTWCDNSIDTYNTNKLIETSKERISPEIQKQYSRLLKDVKKIESLATTQQRNAYKFFISVNTTIENEFKKAIEKNTDPKIKDFYQKEYDSFHSETLEIHEALLHNRDFEKYFHDKWETGITEKEIFNKAVSNIKNVREEWRKPACAWLCVWGAALLWTTIDATLIIEWWIIVVGTAWIIYAWYESWKNIDEIIAEISNVYSKKKEKKIPKYQREEAENKDTETKEDRELEMSPSESDIWNKLENVKWQKTKHNWKKWKKRRYFEWDYWSKGKEKPEIEVYDWKWDWIWAMDPKTGIMKPGWKKPGRNIRDKINAFYYLKDLEIIQKEEKAEADKKAQEAARKKAEDEEARRRYTEIMAELAADRAEARAAAAEAKALAAERAEAKALAAERAAAAAEAKALAAERAAAAAEAKAAAAENKANKIPYIDLM